MHENVCRGGGCITVSRACESSAEAISGPSSGYNKQRRGMTRGIRSQTGRMERSVPRRLQLHQPPHHQRATAPTAPSMRSPPVRRRMAPPLCVCVGAPELKVPGMVDVDVEPDVVVACMYPRTHAYSREMRTPATARMDRHARARDTGGQYKKTRTSDGVYPETRAADREIPGAHRRLQDAQGPAGARVHVQTHANAAPAPTPAPAILARSM
ncbi:hypothetical protein C8J57DRAFT_113664 [Mycena rebaudengoi]|nr:hypothetical protein C8J57DRAFT_113664 [Mycena rebaudengoi]